ncbi:TfdA family Taurine catabolism dioxygenase TauD [Phytophthora infestans]|uniref:TfdA family Taurine catabolism dioxygenase TauD n=1 Tax=Phytophthora infestans TaxID=4787 RepID=A0A833WK20_PHYIN|nr:TfdA family Taurine catabolism dioxygenase TauD [Phytophthora infestans]
MAPKNNAPTSSGSTSVASSPAPVKNALNLEVEHAVFTHPELFGEFPTTTYDPIPELPYENRALKADPSFKNRLADATVTHLEPKIGTEILNLQLHELTDSQKDELALLVAQRGVVFFRDQKISIEDQLALDSEKRIKTQALEPVNLWHSDVSYERQTLRRPIVEFEHPVVRTHPVTGRKALYVNAQFTTRINNLSAAESASILRFLHQHIAQGHEFQVRYRWTKDAVAIWDNRATVHYATYDYLPGNRHAVRVTPHGETPYFEITNEP